VGIRTPEVGETMVLDENSFMEQALLRTVLDPISDEDLAAYRKPYPTRERAPGQQEVRRLGHSGSAPKDVVVEVLSTVGRASPNNQGEGTRCMCLVAPESGGRPRR
jgi:hypothetical protein